MIIIESTLGVTIGPPADREYARDLWHLAAIKGNAMAQYYFGHTTFDLEDPSTEDYQLAEFWLEAAAGKDVAEAYTTLYYINNARADDPPNEHFQMLAMQYLLQARYLGDPEAISIYDKISQELLGNLNQLLFGINQMPFLYPLLFLHLHELLADQLRAHIFHHRRLYHVGTCILI